MIKRCLEIAFSLFYFNTFNDDIKLISPATDSFKLLKEFSKYANISKYSELKNAVTQRINEIQTEIEKEQPSDFINNVKKAFKYTLQSQDETEILRDMEILAIIKKEESDNKEKGFPKGVEF